MDQTRLDVDLIPPEAEYFTVSTVAGLVEEDDPDAQVQWCVPRRLLASIVLVSLDHLGIDLRQPAAPEGLKQMLPVSFESLLARLGKA
jgi:hypothetical protein